MIHLWFADALRRRIQASKTCKKCGHPKHFPGLCSNAGHDGDGSPIWCECEG